MDLQLAITDLSSGNRFGKLDEYMAFAFYCPGCSAQFSCEVQREGQPLKSPDIFA